MHKINLSNTIFIYIKRILQLEKKTKIKVEVYNYSAIPSTYINLTAKASQSQDTHNDT